MIRTTLLAVVAFVLAVCLAAADDSDAPPDFSGFGGDRPCPNYRCPRGRSPVQTSRSKFVSNGCSKMGGGMMVSGGGGMGGEKYAVCCDRWHACYQTCGAAKSTCDSSFKSCYGELCAGDGECTRAADLNHMMLGLGGCGLYDEGQNGACMCVEKEKVEEKRAAALRAFYRRVAPEQAGKADALARKADTATKMAALFRKLHVKYPKSIRVEVDDAMARMQEMMRNAGEGKGGGDDTTVIEEEDFDNADDGETEEL